jgi:Zn-dependent peptidase ImmA (M78 family)
MGRLKYYDKEKKQLDLLGFDYKSIVNSKEAIKIVRKLSRHFKITEPEIYFYGKMDYGYASTHINMIKLSHNPSYYSVIHELGHIYTIQNKLLSGKFHTKKLTRIVKRFAKYIIKKNYWKKEND